MLTFSVFIINFVVCNQIVLSILVTDENRTIKTEICELLQIIKKY